MYSDGAHLLRKCIEAEYHHRLLIEEYQESRDRIFAGHYPGYETRWGKIQQETISVENAVVYIIESEERIKDEMKSLQEERTLLSEALKTLTRTELEQFNHIVWGKSLDHKMNDEQLLQVSKNINNKLCKYFDERMVKWSKIKSS